LFQQRINVGVHDVGKARKNTHNVILTYCSDIGQCPAAVLMHFACQLFNSLKYLKITNFTCRDK
ncbi:hypothetical protein J4V98_24705, partial [Escherichia coli]